MIRVIAMITILSVTAFAMCGCITPDVRDEAEELEPPVDPHAAEAFQKRCDDSLLQAAITRWRDGDIGGCETLLERLLSRNPHHFEGRMMLADLHISQSNVPAAENQLRWLVQQNPQNPQARHSLGMLLGTTGRNDEALLHLQEAARLDPQNELYLMCAQLGAPSF